MRTFILNRLEDESGISGTGIVAEGIQFSTGKCAIGWCSDSEVNSVAVYNRTKERTEEFIKGLMT